MKTIPIFFDTEFTGLRQYTSIISLGIVTLDNKTFYAEFTDYDVLQVDDWIEKNVISKLQFRDKITASCGGWMKYGDKGNEHLDKCTNAIEFELAKKDLSCIEITGKTPFIVHNLKKWLDQFKPDTQEVHPNQHQNVDENVRLEVWSDVLAYDWVLFQQLFGGAFEMPKYIHYIPFDIATAFKMRGIDPDINREEYAFGKSNGSLDIATKNKHNALWDAIVIRDCYKKLHDIK